MQNMGGRAAVGHAVASGPTWLRFEFRLGAPSTSCPVSLERCACQDFRPKTAAPNATTSTRITYAARSLSVVSSEDAASVSLFFTVEFTAKIV